MLLDGALRETRLHRGPDLRPATRERRRPPVDREEEPLLVHMGRALVLRESDLQTPALSGVGESE